MRLLRRSLWLVTAAYWAAICVMTHIPQPPPMGPTVSDKIKHFVVFALLAALVHASLRLRWPLWRGVAWATLAIVLVYGAADEWTQPFFGRTCSLIDWLADAAGASTGLAIALVVWRWIARR